MTLKTFIGIFMAAAFGFYLIFFTTTENFNAPPEASAPSWLQSVLIGTGFTLSLPSLPFIYFIDRIFCPQWAAICTWFMGSLFSACFWSFAARYMITQIRRAKA